MLRIKKIHYELFTTPVEEKISNDISKPKDLIGEVSSAGTSQLSNITIKLDGLSFDFKLSPDGESVLEAALALGADLPFSCKGGVCSTCRAKLLEGKVKMDLNYALEPEEVEAGYILTCQSHPLTGKSSDRF